MLSKGNRYEKTERNLALIWAFLLHNTEKVFHDTQIMEDLLLWQNASLGWPMFPSAPVNKVFLTDTARLCNGQIVKPPNHKDRFICKCQNLVL